MRWTCALLLLTTAVSLADNQEKAEKKALDLQAKAFVKEAKDLEKAGNLLEARARYASSQAFTETKDSTEAIKRIDGEIRKRVKDTLHQARQLYDKGNFKQAAELLETAAKQGGASSAFSHNLALCYRRMGDTAASLGHLDQAVMGTPDPKRKMKLRQLRSALITGEQAATLKNDERDRINKINQLIESIGFETSVDEAPPALQPQVEVGAAIRSNISAAPTDARKVAGRNINLCQSLGLLSGPIAKTPSVLFDLANCAEENDRPADASRLFADYLQAAPNANDAWRVKLRIEKLNALAALPGPAGVSVRSLSATASRALESRRYDSALDVLQKAAVLAPDFSPTEWKLALLFEAVGDLEQSRKHFETYRKLEADPLGQQEADLHLETLEVKRAKYDEEVERASEILADLFNRAMNLTFNGLEDRASQYKRRAKERAKVAQKHKVRMVGGFSVPFGYAQQQLAEAGEHLAAALVLFPLGPEANQLMGLVFLQANDGRSAMRSFDAVASQNFPVAFYAEMRGKKKDHAVKCELSRDGVRMILLSSYDKNARPSAPAKPAGEDGLGDLVIDPYSERAQDFESLTIQASEIRSIETKNGHVVLKLAKETLLLSPIYLPAFPPSDGPAGRRFGNNYTRLFVRYPGLEESKLGAEGLTGYEKVKLGYDIANAAYGIAGSLNPMGAIGALETFVQITREIQSVAKSLRVNFAAWLRTIEDQQDLLSGNSFKPIPTEPPSTAFVEDVK